MDKRTDSYTQQNLGQGLSALVVRMEPGEAAATVTQAMAKATEPNGRALAQGLSAVAARMEPGQAAATLTQAMAQTTSSGAIDAFADGLSGVLTPAYRPELSRRSVATLTAVGTLAGAGQPLAGLGTLGPALEPAPCRFSTADLVDLLKQPTCTGRARRVILDQLENRYHQRFADQWAFVRFAREQNLGLDFTTPPKRLALAPTGENK
jgi:hypothetical protein